VGFKEACQKRGEKGGRKETARTNFDFPLAKNKKLSSLEISTLDLLAETRGNAL
jgi:hypothetical protein